MTLLNNKFTPISQVTNNRINSLSGSEIEVLTSDISSLTQIEKKFIEEHLVEIAKGIESTYPANIVAKKIYRTLCKFDKTSSTVIGQKDPRINSGFAAEFFLICILRDNEFAQQFCYRNLEENSAKKGFDGLYARDGEMWLVESKSTHTAGNTHQTTITRAYDGITDQLDGNTSNDPWENAASHVKNATSNMSLVARLEQYSIDYMSGNYRKLSDSNLIIGSTVVNENCNDSGNGVQNIDSYIATHQTLYEKIVAINLSDQQIFIDVMEEIANG